MLFPPATFTELGEKADSRGAVEKGQTDWTVQVNYCHISFENKGKNSKEGRNVE